MSDSTRREAKPRVVSVAPLLNLTISHLRWRGIRGHREGDSFVPKQTRDEMRERTNWGTLLTPELLDPQAPGLPGPADEGPQIRRPEW